MNLIIDGMHLEGFSLINWIIKSSTSVFLYHDGCNGFYSYISFFFGGFLWTWFIYLFFWNVFECNFSILLWNFHFVCYIFMHLVKGRAHYISWQGAIFLFLHKLSLPKPVKVPSRSSTCFRSQIKVITLYIQLTKQPGYNGITYWKIQW